MTGRHQATFLHLYQSYYWHIITVVVVVVDVALVVDLIALFLYNSFVEYTIYIPMKFKS